MKDSSKRHSKLLSLIFILNCLSKASVIRIKLISAENTHEKFPIVAGRRSNQFYIKSEKMSKQHYYDETAGIKKRSLFNKAWKMRL